MAGAGHGHVPGRPREFSRIVLSTEEEQAVAAPDDQPPMSDPTNRRRARVLIPLAIFVALVLILLFIYLVHWIGR
jgi:hypothetical protein